MEDKIYILNDDCIWNDENLSNIVLVTQDKDIALKYLKDYVEQVKKDIDFDSLEAFEETEDFDYSDPDAVWIYSESNDKFEVYENGSYNSNHICINIEVRELVKEYTKEEELCH